MLAIWKSVANSPSARSRGARDETVDPGEYYFRTTPVFATGSDRYEWLNNIVCVAVGERLALEVRYKVFKIF